MMTLPPSVAAAIGRPDLSRSRAGSPGRGTTKQAERSARGETAGVAANILGVRAGANIDTSQLSAAAVGVIVVALVALYVWTRGHQG